MDEQAPDPGFEAIRVTQCRELAPDGDEGALQGILGEDVVPEDPCGEGVHPVAGHVDQRRECLAIAVLGSDDEIPHRHSLEYRAMVTWSHPMSGPDVPNVHDHRELTRCAQCA